MLRADVVVAFPMSTFIYANLISILNVQYVWVCVWVCVCAKIHFAAPSCLGFTYSLPLFLGGKSISFVIAFYQT